MTALTLLAPLVPVTLAVGAADAASYGQAAASGRSDAKRAVKGGLWVKHRVEYGDKKVLLKHGTTHHRIVFDGRKGDRVRLDGFSFQAKSDPDCDWLELTRHGRSIGKPDVRAVHAYWKLPRNGRYTFKLRRCGYDGKQEHTTQLLKLRTYKVDGKNGAATRLDRKRGYENVAVLRVPERGRWTVHVDGVRGSLNWVPGSVAIPSVYSEWFDPNASNFGEIPASIPDLVVRAGEPARFLNIDYDARWGYAPGKLAKSLTPGKRIFVQPHGRKHVRVSLHRVPATNSTVEVGGVLAGVASRRPRALTSAKVTVPTSRWVRLEVVPGSDEPGSGAGSLAWVVGPSGAQPVSPTYGLVQLPAGASTVWFAATRGAAALRLTPVTEAPAQRVDGTDVTYTADEAGAWSVAPLRFPAGPSYRIEVTSTNLTSTHATLAPSWKLAVGSHMDLHAYIGCRDIGCSYERGIRWFDTDHREGWPQGDLPAGEATREGLVVFQPSAWTRGTVTVRVTPVG